MEGWAALRNAAWAYPVLECLHLVGVALLIGNLVLFELRVLGLGRGIDIAPLARLALPLAVAGFLLAAMSGSLMFATRPGELLTNPAFKWKLALLFVAGLNAALFHTRGSLQRADTLACVQAAASALLWISVLVCGRMIAYV